MNMSETEKDHGIMLFGWKIPVPECPIPANSGPMVGTYITIITT